MSTLLSSSREKLLWVRVKVVFSSSCLEFSYVYSSKSSSSMAYVILRRKDCSLKDCMEWGLRVIAPDSM